MAKKLSDPPPELQKTRIHFLMNEPFLGMLSCNTELKWREDIKTACTNGDYIAFNQEYHDYLLFREREGVFAHETLHIMFEHHLVFASTDWMDNHDVFNVAADVIINKVCLDNGYKLPENGILPHNWPFGVDDFFKIAKMNIYEAYKYVASKFKKRPPDDGEGEPCEDGEDGTGGQGKSPSDKSEDDDKPELPDHRATGEVEPWQPEGDDDGDEGDGDDGDEDGKGSGEGEGEEEGDGDGDGKGKGRAPTKEEIENKSEETKKRIAQALASAKLQGKMPGGLERIVEDILKPKLKWSFLLMRDVAQTSRSTYTWYPPNRRFIHQDLYLPRMTGQSIGHGLYIGDTSGSMDVPTMGEITSELNGLFSTHAGTCTVISCDAEVQNVQEFNSQKLPFEPDWKGGGGTNYRPAFRWVDENMKGKRIDFAIYATDGWCDRFPDKAPKYPVFWVVWDYSDFKPPFGKVIYVD